MSDGEGRVEGVRLREEWSDEGEKGVSDGEGRVE